MTITQAGRAKESEKRYAVILFGLVHRSIKHTAPTLRENLLGPLRSQGKLDLFYHSWDNCFVNNPRANEAGCEVSPQDFIDEFPDAVGAFSSQKEYDQSVNWEQIFSNNPLRFVTSSTEAARESMRNFKRATASLRNAWQIFENNRTGIYDAIVVTRADLMFTQPISVPNGCSRISRGILWVPDFQSWGGVNDRFAIGTEDVVKLYCNREEFTDGWLLKAERENPEWLLKAWLSRNKVETRSLAIRFQRVRANGNIAARDLSVAEYSALPNGATGSSSPSLRFLILCRRTSKATAALERLLEKHGMVEIISDTPQSDAVWYDDDAVRGYGGLMSDSGTFPAITAWSRAMYHLSLTLRENELVWFWEDDVAADQKSLQTLVSEVSVLCPDYSAPSVHSREEDSHWPHWRYGSSIGMPLYRSFKPLSCKSSKLIQEALRFRESQGRFIFHEILFPTLAKQFGMKMIAWNDLEFGRGLLRSFRYRPAVTAATVGVSHPVKDPNLVAEIAALTGRCGSFAFSHLPKYHQNIFKKLCGHLDISTFEEFDGHGEFVKVGVDLGSENESSALLDLTEVIPRPDCQSDLGLIVRSDDVAQEGFLPALHSKLVKDEPRLAVFFIDPLSDEIRGCFTGLGYYVTRLCSDFWVALIGDERSRDFAAPYLSLEEGSSDSISTWFSTNYLEWLITLSSDEPLEILDIGSRGPTTAALFLDHLFSNPLTKVIWVEGLSDGKKKVLSGNWNERLASYGDRILKLEGEVQRAVGWLISGGEDVPEYFDVVHVACANDPNRFYMASCPGWELLRPGGLMLLSELEGGSLMEITVRNFMALCGESARMVIAGKTVALQKSFPSHHDGK